MAKWVVDVRSGVGRAHPDVLAPLARGSRRDDGRSDRRIEPTGITSAADILRDAIITCLTRRQKIDAELAAARADLQTHDARKRRRELPIIGRLLPEDVVAEASLRSRIMTLEGAREDAHFQVRFEPAARVHLAFHELSRRFDSLAASSRVWDVTAEREARAADRNELPPRQPASIERRSGRAAAFDGVLTFSGAGGRTIEVYPGFVLAWGADGGPGVHDIRDLQVMAAIDHRAESETVPSDTEVVRNESAAIGSRHHSPHLRGGDRLPVCAYGRLSLHLSGEPASAFLLSASATAQAFADGWSAYLRDVCGSSEAGRWD